MRTEMPIHSPSLESGTRQCSSDSAQQGGVSETAPQSPLLRRTLRDVAIILLCAALPAAAMYGAKSKTPDAASEVTAAPAGKEVIWIDARSAEEFAKEHVPGALSLNEENWEHALPHLFEVWRPDQPIIVYCSAGCPASAKIAAKLRDLGIEPVQTMKGGIEEWKRSKQ